MAKGAVVVPTEEEINEFGLEPDAEPVDERLLMRPVEDMQRERPTTWWQVVNQIGRQNAKRHGGSERQSLRFYYPEFKLEGKKWTQEFFTDVNNPNIRFRYTVAAPELVHDKNGHCNLWSEKENCYRWDIQIALHPVYSTDPLPDGSLPDNIEIFDASQDITYKTDLGVEVTIALPYTRIVKNSGIDPAYMQNIIERCAQRFAADFLPAMCRKHHTRVALKGVPQRMPGTRGDHHAHEFFILMVT